MASPVDYRAPLAAFAISPRRLVGVGVADGAPDEDIDRLHRLAVEGPVPVVRQVHERAVEIQPAVDALRTRERDHVGNHVRLGTHPTGPAATLASPPSLKLAASIEFMPFSVITSVIISDTDTPAWKPTLPVAIV